ncbi:hypothetical protein K474DRAFT_1680641 [Panus rudis PR-1116 ss-1]|nr:hypothetical protein K474DRAFT_1680641 [Panus rudis PR-1116 ss-1]
MPNSFLCVCGDAVFPPSTLSTWASSGSSSNVTPSTLAWFGRKLSLPAHGFNVGDRDRKWPGRKKQRRTRISILLAAAVAAFRVDMLSDSGLSPSIGRSLYSQCKALFIMGCESNLNTLHGDSSSDSAPTLTCSTQQAVADEVVPVLPYWKIPVPSPPSGPVPEIDLDAAFASYLKNYVPPEQRSFERPKRRIVAALKPTNWYRRFDIVDSFENEPNGGAPSATAESQVTLVSSATAHIARHSNLESAINTTPLAVAHAFMS